MTECFIVNSELSVKRGICDRQPPLEKPSKLPKALDSSLTTLKNDVRKQDNQTRQYESNSNILQGFLHEMKYDLRRRKVRIIKKSKFSAVIFYDDDGDLKKEKGQFSHNLQIRQI